MVVDLLAELFRHGADSKRVLHVPVIRVILWHEFFIGMDGIVMMEVVAQVIFELVQEA